MTTHAKSRPIRCVITAGPTREYFDPVRFLSNPSSGKMGYALARSAVKAGWEVHLISGPVALSCPEGVVDHTSVTSGEDLYKAARTAFESCDILIMAAAVCDQRPRVVDLTKQKKAALPSSVELVPVVDVLQELGKVKDRQRLVGFAAETGDLEAEARRKLASKYLDAIVANRVGLPGSGFESDINQGLLIDGKGRVQSFGPERKEVIAAWLIEQFMLTFF